MTTPAHDPTGAVLRGLRDAAARMRADGLPVPEPEGKLLRPLVAWSALSPRNRARVDERFWFGALAIQMVHEASLLHDDIVDGAATRRGAPTRAAEDGVGRALVLGDHYLTAAYRVAAAAGLPAFLSCFIRAVERTVAGEIVQQRGAGRILDPADYRAAIEGKSGELFAAAVALAADWSGTDVGPAMEAGRRVGALYQMVDDALDYCPALAGGKPALQDYRQRKWTFVLGAAGFSDFDADPDDVVARIFVENEGAVADAVLARLDEEADAAIAGFPTDDGQACAVFRDWVGMARAGYARQRATVIRRERSPGTALAPTPEAEVVALARAVGGPDRWSAYFGRHARSFRFAARLFPRDARRAVEGVYAFCRFTDDLVDETDVGPERARARVEAWRDLARTAFEGGTTGVPLADRVLGDAARHDVPFHYADDLLTGVAMDLEPVCFERMVDLEVYTYRVASVVGGWITERFGVHDSEVLARAYGLGHGMQITNILRDVGEDWRSDRLYLPRDLMDRFSVGPELVDRVATGRGPAPVAWVELLESLMAVADRHYANAFEALPALPPFYARPVAVAARVYQGIHDEIRRNAYDNGTRRAFTSLRTKLRLGWTGLRDLRRARTAVRGTRTEWSLAPQDG